MKKYATLLLSSAILLSPITLAKMVSADESVIAERQSNFKQTGMAMRMMRGHIQAGDFEAISASADAIANWAKAMPDFFPQGTGPDDVSTRTAANQSIWDRWDEFTALANDNYEAAMVLKMAASNEDSGAVMEAMQNLGRTCGACHSPFKD